MIDHQKSIKAVMVVFFLAFIAALVVIYKVICPAIWSV